MINLNNITPLKRNHLYVHSLLILFIKFQLLIPVNSVDRKDISQLKLTEIGGFGLLRKGRSGIPGHYHTGIDIRRLSKNYFDEPIFSLAEGTVISKRTDGAYAQLIIEHYIRGKWFWTLYEHIAGIKVNVNDHVYPGRPIARFMNVAELNHYGWQFDHFHLEILKIKPVSVKKKSPYQERLYTSYSLICYTPKDLLKYYYDPIEFMRSNIDR